MNAVPVQGTLAERAPEARRSPCGGELVPDRYTELPTLRVPKGGRIWTLADCWPQGGPETMRPSGPSASRDMQLRADMEVGTLVATGASIGASREYAKLVRMMRRQTRAGAATVTFTWDRTDLRRAGLPPRAESGGGSDYWRLWNSMGRGNPHGRPTDILQSASSAAAPLGVVRDHRPTRRSSGKHGLTKRRRRG